MFWQWWRRKMEEFGISQLHERIEKLSQSIEKYLQSDELPDIKKELLKKMISSTTTEEISENVKRDFYFIERKNIPKDEKIFLRGYVISDNSSIGSIENTVNKIISFNDVDFLEFINEHISHKAKEQIASSLQLYNDLADFAHSGIDEKHFPSPEKFKKKVAELQKFSSTPIVLDKFPKHPSQAIREFFSDELFVFPCEIVNKAISNTKAVFKSEYKKMPKITKLRQEELKQYDGDQQQMITQEYYRIYDNYLNRLLEQYRTDKKNIKLIFKAFNDGLSPNS